MGLLNLPFPLFDALDRAMRGVVPPLAALVVWAVLAAVLSMLLYRAVSRQDAISRIGAEAARARRALLVYDGELDGLRGLAVETLGTSAKQLWLTLVPAIVASLPLVSLLAWLSLAYGHSYPAPGSMVRVEVLPAAAGLSWEPVAERDGQQGAWRIPWPASGEQARLIDPLQREILSIPPAVPGQWRPHRSRLRLPAPDRTPRPRAGRRARWPATASSGRSNARERAARARLPSPSAAGAS